MERKVQKFDSNKSDNDEIQHSKTGGIPRLRGLMSSNIQVTVNKDTLSVSGLGKNADLDIDRDLSILDLSPGIKEYKGKKLQ